jgi:hypothetical protein
MAKVKEDENTRKGRNRVGEGPCIELEIAAAFRGRYASADA